MHRPATFSPRGRRRSGRVASLGALSVTVLVGSACVTGSASAVTSAMALHTVDLSPSVSDYSYELLSLDAYDDAEPLEVPESGNVWIGLPEGVKAKDGQPLTAKMVVEPSGEIVNGVDEEEPTFMSSTTPGFTAEVVNSRVEVRLPMDLLSTARDVNLSVGVLGAYEGDESLAFDYHLYIAEEFEARSKPALAIAPTLLTKVAIGTDVRAAPGDVVNVQLPKTSDLRSKGFDRLSAEEFRLETVQLVGGESRKVPLQVNSDGSVARVTIPDDLDFGAWNLSFAEFDQDEDAYNATIVDATINVGAESGADGDPALVPVPVPTPVPAGPSTPPAKPAPAAGQQPVALPAPGASSTTQPGTTTRPVGTNVGLHSDTGVEDVVRSGSNNVTGLSMLVGGSTLAGTASFVLLRRGRRLGRG